MNNEKLFYLLNLLWGFMKLVDRIIISKNMGMRSNG